MVTAVANGDLERKFTVEAKGEIAALADTINSMIDTLATFADQVTTVAREVGVEGKLGGQASVPGAASAISACSLVMPPSSRNWSMISMCIRCPPSSSTSSDFVIAK